MDLKERFLGCFLGLAIGDAVGTTLEFRKRGTFDSITDMTGGGPFNLAAGQWTDDTSMALCLAASLAEKKNFDALDQMTRYLRWYKEGYMSSTGRCFDIGNTVRHALKKFEITNDPYSGDTSPYSAGNGSLMRLAPIPIYYFPDLEKIILYSAESSRTTHGASECLQACQLFAELVYNAFLEKDKDKILFQTSFLPTMPKIKAIAEGQYRNKMENQINGSGYVVESMEAALWCFYNTHSFRNAILMAANLGDDADTTAAICGQIAGAYYGVVGIPETWLSKLFMRTEIELLVDKLTIRL